MALMRMTMLEKVTTSVGRMVRLIVVMMSVYVMMVMLVLGGKPRLPLFVRARPLVGSADQDEHRVPPPVELAHHAVERLPEDSHDERRWTC
jgi:hypothetical protein